MTRVVQVTWSFWLHAWSWNIISRYIAKHFLQCQLWESGVSSEQCNEYFEDELGLDEDPRYLINNLINDYNIDYLKVKTKSNDESKRLVGVEGVEGGLSLDLIPSIQSQWQQCIIHQSKLEAKLSTNVKCRKNCKNQFGLYFGHFLDITGYLSNGIIFLKLP